MNNNNMSESEKVEGDSKTAKNLPIKKTSDLIKLKLDKLMQNFDKPVVIPERPKSKQGPSVPDFVRNVMGSSAGAGSGEFHVYRHLRRKEYARRKFIEAKSELEKEDEAYHLKVEENRRAAAQATAKKRAKRLKRKEAAKTKKIKKDDDKKESGSESSS